jgi:hypothetical protein
MSSPATGAEEDDRSWGKVKSWWRMTGGSLEVDRRQQLEGGRLVEDDRQLAAPPPEV